MKEPILNQALQILAPNAQYTILGDDLSGLIWLDVVQTRPTDADITAQIALQGK